MSELPDDNLTPEERLLETAVSDAMGLLDEEDAALFERAFYAAPASLRLRIIALQASIVESSAFGSTDEPAPGRRTQVVDAVMREVDQSVEELAPLAIIGREIRTNSKRGLFMPATLWRAASLALAAGLVTSLVFVFQALEDNRTLAAALFGGSWERPLDEFADLRLATLTAQEVRTLSAVSSDHPTCSATLCLDLERGSVAVYGFGLKGGSFKVQVFHGETLLVEEPLRQGRHGVSGAMLACASEHRPLLAASTIRIVDGAGNVILA